MTTDDTAPWARYWAHGNVTSCAGAFDGNYEGSMRTLWERRFAALPDGTRLLDIGTGNGAVALIAAATARRHNRKFVIDALDLAEIDPQRHLPDEFRGHSPDISFHSRTDICKTGFDNDSFDIVTGHFALEYADLPAAVAELARVTARDGENMFVLHSDESVLVRTAREECTHINLLLEETRILDRARDLIAKVPGAAKERRQDLVNDPAVESSRLALNAAAAQLSAVIEESAHPGILRTALGRIRAAYRLLDTHDRTSALQALDQAKMEIIDNAARLDGLRRAALSREDIDRLAGVYEDHGFGDVDVNVLSQEPAGLLGWVLRARVI